MVQAKGQWTYTLDMLKTVFSLADDLGKDKEKKGERNLAIVIMTDALDDPPPGKKGDQFDLTKIAEQYSGKNWWIYLVNLSDLEKSERVAVAQEELRKELLKVSEKTMIVDGTDPEKAINLDIAQDIKKKELLGSNIIPFIIAGLLLFLLLIFLFSRFSSITVFTQHLAIFGSCFSSFVPRCDMVALHLLYLVIFGTNRTNAFLPFIGFSFVVVAKCSNI